MAWTLSIVMNTNTQEQGIAISSNYYVMEVQVVAGMAPAPRREPAGVVCHVKKIRKSLLPGFCLAWKERHKMCERPDTIP